LRKYIYGPGIDEPVCMIKLDGLKYYHFDGLGSVVALSNSYGNVAERYSYDVFGKPTIRNAQGNIISLSAHGNRYMFTGRRHDYETGNYYYRARYYSPSIGRFLQPDPVGYVAGLNLYTYCGNNPVNLIDPEGKIIDWMYHCIQCFRYIGKAMDDAKKCREENPCDTQARWECMRKKPNFKKALKHCTECGFGSWFNP
jgi:RHS repeat-associated protein